MIKELNDIQVRFLKKIFITWLKKEGFYEDYINAKTYLKMHYQSPNRDGWPHDLNESELYYDYDEYCNLIDRTIDYYRCKHIRSDWSSINMKWCIFAINNEALIVKSFLL